ncbi:MAG: hypothetical protein PXZ08_06550 [Actinomycetota bacterium]|jgi:hypothetical protein|nr:hypothetical protein [Actinomycetota bacterium]
MGRRLLFILGLVSAAYGGWVVHRESALNAYCNAAVAGPARGLTVPSRCLSIVWPYAEGFFFAVLGALFVFAALLLTRRVMSGERQYMKDLRAGKYSRENDHLNAYNFNKSPTVRVSAAARRGLYDVDDHEQS